MIPISHQDNEDLWLAKLRKIYADRNIPIMTLQTWFYLKQLLDKYQPYSSLEIGTAVWFGTMLIACQVHKWWGQIVSFEISYPSYHQALQYMSQWWVTNTSLYHLDFLKVDLSLYLTHPLDFVWIDGQKSQYPSYIIKVLPYLSPGAICVLDDVVQYPQTQDRIRQIADQHGYYYHIVSLSDGDGLGLFSKRV